MNVPKLRFKEFNDEWKKEKFLKFTYNAGKRNKDGLDLTPYAITNNLGFVPQTEAHNEFGYMKNTDRKAYNIVTKNSFAYNPARINVGSIGYYENSENIIVSSLYEVFKTKEYIDDKFIWYWLKSDKFPRWIDRLQEGSVRQYFYYDKLCETVTYIPSLKEQSKISQTLSLLDKKIELQSRKIEALKLYKLGQIKDFFKNSNFENCKLKDIGQFISSNSIGKEKITNKGVPLILYGDLYTKYNETIQDIKQFCNDNEKYIKSELNDLIFPTSTTVDAISLISPSSVKVNGAVYGGDIIIFKSNIKDINSDFLSFEINNYLKKYFSTFAQGSTIIHIQADNLLNCNILLPNIKIQIKMASCFNLYNRKIKLEEEKLSKLEILKKGLMQQLFI